MDKDNDFIHEDFDSSEEVPKHNFKSANEHRKSVISKLKAKIHDYRTPEAKQERRIKKLAKREREIEDLTYKAKKEKLKGVIRKSRSVAKPTFGYPSYVTKTTRKPVIHAPRDNLDSLFSIYGPAKPKTKKSKKKSNPYAGMDRMFGIN